MITVRMTPLTSGALEALPPSSSSFVARLCLPARRIPVQPLFQPGLVESDMPDLHTLMSIDEMNDFVTRLQQCRIGIFAIPCFAGPLRDCAEPCPGHPFIRGECHVERSAGGRRV